MKKRNGFIIPSKYLFGAFLIICLVLIFLSYATGFSGGPIKVLTNYVVVPLERGTSYVTDTIVSRSKDSRTRQELAEDNAKLQAEIEQLKSEISAQSVKLKELDRLTSLLSLKENYDEFPTTGARVIASGATNYYNTFTIDKGSADGIAKDMNVLADGGLVGIVTEVGINYSIVRSIIDDSSAVSASFASTGDNCILSGSINNYKSNGLIAFSGLDDPEGNVKSGDIVTTSQISDKYLPGIMIGYTVNITPDTNNLTVSGTIVPTASFKHLNEVIVILKTKKDYSSDGN